ncbi:MAG: AAA family ATPase [Candidatus Limnocylindria bacterium]
MARQTPKLVFIVGPPAVGKMTVGAALAARTGLGLFHNHRTIDLVLPFFAFGSPPFNRLVGEFRRRILEEVASSDLPGLIFTYVWAFDQPVDDAEVEAYSTIFRAQGGVVFYVELQASQDVRLRRNETEFRLAEKPFKRDLVESRRQLISLDRYQLDSGGRFDGRPDYLRIDNTDLSPEDVAERIIRTFGLDLAST